MKRWKPPDVQFGSSQGSICMESYCGRSKGGRPRVSARQIKTGSLASTKRRRKKRSLKVVAGLAPSVFRKMKERVSHGKRAETASLNCWVSTERGSTKEVGMGKVVRASTDSWGFGERSE